MKWGGGPRSGGGVLTQDSSVARAREMRRALTPPEARLWVCLRRRGLDEPKSRRQHPVGPYVLDFYCAEARLAVEVDGQGHLETGDHDARRDRWLAGQGIAVLRIPAEEVRVHLDGVLTFIGETAEARIRG